ncbi:MAG: hypothetical protein ABL955_13965 [Elusimicrobiota bacterium]
MHSKIFAPVLLALAFTSAAHAASAPFKLPTVHGYAVTLPGIPVLPISLPTVNAVIAAPALAPTLNASALPVPAPISLPVLPAAAIGQAHLPSIPSPLPLPTPAALKTSRSAPMIIEEFVINWSLLDDKGGDEAAPALVPNNPGPQPLSPAGALNELRDVAQGRDPIRVTPGNLFDGRRRETHRELELPSNKYF